MRTLAGGNSRSWIWASSAFLLTAVVALGQQAPFVPRQFLPGTLKRLADLPSGRLRTHIESLPTKARLRALEELRGFHFTELDLRSLRTDPDGAIFYEENFSLPLEPLLTESEVSPAAALNVTLPVNPFPPSLMFHSKPGAPNIIFLNFCGESISNTAWNTSLGRAVIPAVAFSKDADFATFTSTEQAAIKSIWQRVSEDYAPFNVDVTTERPGAFGTRTAHALITRNTDANGDPNPSSTGGGVAYVNKFTAANYANYRPAWVYYNNLSGNESYIAEATSHEIGHNLGLSHDGKTDGTEYYSGHGSGDTSWGPIMGSAYNRNVSQWSKGEYYQANNTQDDLATIVDKIPYLADDHGNFSAMATPLVTTDQTNIVSTTPETDPDNLNSANKGILERNTDVDVFCFTTGTGMVRVIVNPWIMPSGTRGGNLDVLLELYDESGVLRASATPAAQTYAQIQTNLPQGSYFLHVRNAGAGNPTNSAPSGYTAYSSIGKYFLSGYIVRPSAPQPVQLIANVNHSAWGSVNPTNAMFPLGSTAQVLATPAPFYRFAMWTNDAVGTNNPLSIVLNNNVELEAVFVEIVTTNHPTPHWWLASCGYTNNFESAVTNFGHNGVPLWQSYIVGLNPNDPTGQFRMGLTHRANAGDVLSWNAVTGRVYTLFSSTNLVNGFVPLAGATNLPWTTAVFTNALNLFVPALYYRVEVRKP